MELHEFHIAQLGSGSVSGGHAVAGGHRRVRRFTIDHAGAATGKNDLLGPDEQPVVSRPVDERADTGALVDEEIDGEGPVPDRDVWAVPGAVDDSAHNLMS